MSPSGEAINPRDDGELPATESINSEFRLIEIVVAGAERLFLPDRFLVGPITEQAMYQIMPISKEIDFDEDHIMHDALDRKLAPLDARPQVFDHDAAAAFGR